MPNYKVVIKDAALAQEAEIQRNIAHNRKVFPGASPQAIEARVRAKFQTQRPAGSEYSHGSTECPEGRPNCRNCGDPAHADTCKAAGHCPQCGTVHGMSPDSYIAASGYELVEV